MEEISFLVCFLHFLLALIFLLVGNFLLSFWCFLIRTRVDFHSDDRWPVLILLRKSWNYFTNSIVLLLSSNFHPTIRWNFFHCFITTPSVFLYLLQVGPFLIRLADYWLLEICEPKYFCKSQLGVLFLWSELPIRGFRFLLDSKFRINKR